MVHFELWGLKGATCADRPLFTAAELGVPVDFHTVDITAGQQKTADYLLRQPFGKIPAAELDGHALFESRAIARVLARATPGGEQLFPSTDIQRVAMFEQWASLESGTISPILEKVVGEKLFKPMFGMSTDEKAAKDAMDGGQTAFRILDTQLSDKQYVIGDFSLIDVFLSTNFGYFAKLPEGKQTFEQYPNIGAWWQRVASRPAWQKVVTERQLKVPQWAA